MSEDRKNLPTAVLARKILKFEPDKGTSFRSILKDPSNMLSCNTFDEAKEEGKEHFGDEDFWLKSLKVLDALQRIATGVTNKDTLVGLKDALLVVDKLRMSDNSMAKDALDENSIDFSAFNKKELKHNRDHTRSDDEIERESKDDARSDAVREHYVFNRLVKGYAELEPIIKDLARQLGIKLIEPEGRGGTDGGLGGRS